uniref:Uncharacterized protein n=1 Tax=Panagrolaimus sp. ES5 TaxID=591445 RepID=A0AC34GFM5_9BILA
MRRRFYQQVMPLVYQKYATLFGNKEYDHLVDYANAMYSFANLSLDDESVKEKLLELSLEEAASVTKNASVSLSLKRGQLEFIGDNFSGVCEDLESCDASVLRFTELATSHSVAQDFEENCMPTNNATYFMNPENHGYPANSTPDLGNGKFLAVGAEKSVILIEGPDSSYSVFSNIIHSDGDSLAAVVLESKKTPFYKSMPLIDIVSRMLMVQPNDTISAAQIASIQPLIKNLACHRTYGNATTGL